MSISLFKKFLTWPTAVSVKRLGQSMKFARQTQAEVPDAKQYANSLHCLWANKIFIFVPKSTSPVCLCLIKRLHLGFYFFLFFKLRWSVNGCSALISCNTCHIDFPTGLDSDESYEGVSEASFKDALVFDGSTQKNNGSVRQENGIKKHRYCYIPALPFTCSVYLYVCYCP